ncbi:ATP-citrate lyase A-1 [Striga asiatica]|uniref:ATP-citrate lyase A-1 n=1 Tax=Striga asiatica TaxID=4170 RepID=A0A5A7QKF7_STRAF|nr:ATP-citrate lyase A-1 [Striga asiatica]
MAFLPLTLDDYYISTPVPFPAQVSSAARLYHIPETAKTRGIPDFGCEKMDELVFDPRVDHTLGVTNQFGGKVRPDPKADRGKRGEFSVSYKIPKRWNPKKAGVALNRISVLSLLSLRPGETFPHGPEDRTEASWEFEEAEKASKRVQLRLKGEEQISRGGCGSTSPGH